MKISTTIVRHELGAYHQNLWGPLRLWGPVHRTIMGPIRRLVLSFKHKSMVTVEHPD